MVYFPPYIEKSFVLFVTPKLHSWSDFDFKTNILMKTIFAYKLFWTALFMWSSFAHKYAKISWRNSSIAKNKNANEF